MSLLTVPYSLLFFTFVMIKCWFVVRHLKRCSVVLDMVKLIFCFAFFLEEIELDYRDHHVPNTARCVVVIDSYIFRYNLLSFFERYERLKPFNVSCLT